jgi:hypothetical protein
MMLAALFIIANANAQDFSDKTFISNYQSLSAQNRLDELTSKSNPFSSFLARLPAAVSSTALRCIKSAALTSACAACLPSFLKNCETS